MKITHIDIWKVVVPIKPDCAYSKEYEFEIKNGAFWDVPKHIVRVHTDDSGIVGVGETRRGCPGEQVELDEAAVQKYEVK